LLLLTLLALVLAVPALLLALVLAVPALLLALVLAVPALLLALVLAVAALLLALALVLAVAALLLALVLAVPALLLALVLAVPALLLALVLAVPALLLGVELLLVPAALQSLRVDPEPAEQPGVLTRIDLSHTLQLLRGLLVVTPQLFHQPDDLTDVECHVHSPRRDPLPGHPSRVVRRPHLVTAVHCHTAAPAPRRHDRRGTAR